MQIVVLIIFAQPYTTIITQIIIFVNPYFWLDLVIFQVDNMLEFMIILRQRSTGGFGIFQKEAAEQGRFKAKIYYLSAHKKDMHHV